eukprot:775810-Rhodomonas_salina.1
MSGGMKASCVLREEVKGAEGCTRARHYAGVTASSCLVLLFCSDSYGDAGPARRRLCLSRRPDH